MTLPETNDLKHYRALLAFYKMKNIHVSIYDYLILTALDFLFFLKDCLRSGKI